MNCTNCPPSVLVTVAARVQKTLDQVLLIKSITNVFNLLLRDIAQYIADDLQRWVELIPVPPFLDLQNVINYLTCPLTPLVLLTDPQVIPATDPRLYYDQIAKNYLLYLRQIRADFERATDDLHSARIVRLVQAYLREIEQAVKDPLQFPLDFAISLGYVSYIAAVCPELYNDPSYPYQRLAIEMTTFSFNGIVPTNLDPIAKVVVEKVAEAQLRLLAWVQFAMVPT